MKKFLFIVLMIATCGWTGQAEDKKMTIDDLSKEERVSYALGLEWGRGLKKRTPDLDVEMFIRGVRDIFDNHEPLLNPAESRKTMQDFHAKVSNRMKVMHRDIIDRNLKLGNEFLMMNKKKEGVKETQSGLQYKILKQGNDKVPGPLDTIVLHCRGMHLDGTEFHNTYTLDKPVEITLNKVIPGWNEGLQYVSEGGKIRLFIPAYLAYGDEGIFQKIEPGSLLIYDMELIEIKKKQ